MAFLTAPPMSAGANALGSTVTKLNYTTALATILFLGSVAQVSAEGVSFGDIDTDKNGVASAQELTRTFGAAGARGVVDLADADGDGDVGREEAVAAYSADDEYDDEDDDAFADADANNDGNVTRRELIVALGRRDACDILREEDLAANGVISREEFDTARESELDDEAFDDEWEVAEEAWEQIDERNFDFEDSFEDGEYDQAEYDEDDDFGDRDFDGDD